MICLREFAPEQYLVEGYRMIKKVKALSLASDKAFFVMYQKLIRYSAALKLFWMCLSNSVANS